MDTMAIWEFMQAMILWNHLVPPGWKKTETLLGPRDEQEIGSKKAGLRKCQPK